MCDIYIDLPQNLPRSFEQDDQEQMICTLCGTISQDFLSQSQDVVDGGFGGAITSSNAGGT